jgi:hypothetical protein
MTYARPYCEFILADGPTDGPLMCPSENTDGPPECETDIDITSARHMIRRTEYDALQTGEK